ncbi:unnamed protein product [Rhodiola kirilowii]
MSSCGSCDCADKTQCGKRNSSHIFAVAETVSYADTTVIDALVAERDGNDATCTLGSASV